MSADLPPADRPDAALTKVRCRACREEILEGARKCVHCDSYQDWRRYLNVSSSILALLVALVSVTSIMLPILGKTLRGENSKIDLIFIGIEKNFFTLVATNRGPRPGVVPYATLELTGQNGQAVTWKLEPRTELFVVNGDTTKRITFRLQPPEYRMFLLRITRHGEFQAHRLIVRAREFDGSISRFRFDVPPEMFRRFVHYVRNRR